MKITNLGSRDYASFYVACELFKQMSQQSHSKLGLATGGTMVDVYAFLVDLLKKNQLDVSGIETFNLDEYVGLSASHEQSYHRYMNDILFERYPYFTQSLIHVPNGDADDLAAETKRYEDLINQQGPVDIQILGIGENGHIGFNEPGTDMNSTTQVVNLTESTINANSRYFDNEDEVPKQAVSMGLASILKAKRIILLAFGEKKRAAIEQLAKNEVDKQVPATILHAHPDVEIYVDDEAAPRF
ncbi:MULTISPECIES: glucosamine-6-phosphate deaminase [Staphylococcus]|jgi:glucosamine-6-phosphate deaminase|uniref:Glucosamine-6-phosphate deaminase n=1 Tax=Staphylococcus nepalensis TaxID=214473 RepID=A0A291JM88_9STAP|nr:MULTISPECIES: glucosamine-6-phosphate deaminase [Staphylococcus]VDG67985.1 glucosamine-6-phosphate deaminase [Lacrimispora indolis]ATH60984.1 glucosamine-6-phosphate deaminase [Staphylococcus nepalensis]ATH66015.1 glucosamine-6-phosphate deaminase [Staphylococcus nepalensis]AWI45405.1 glucosamine-6-phosphate deaminase [Staphylococcus nepalensis]MBO1206431.1 glucosamine-6-phosphate deaminase [Staphylococcus nepalensis]